MTKLNLLGKKLGNLTVLRYAGSNGVSTLWECKCDCGAVVVKLGKAMTRGSVLSCSTQCAFSRGKISAALTRHGLSLHPLFAVWRSMLARCKNPNCKAYKNYGGRGIEVCERWGDFENFILDMGEGYQSGLTLDRTDNSQGYYKENCRWVSYKTNCRNKRGNRVIDTPRGKMTVSEASETFHIGVTTLLYRLAHNWPKDKLFLSVEQIRPLYSKGLPVAAEVNEVAAYCK